MPEWTPSIGLPMSGKGGLPSPLQGSEWASALAGASG